MKNSFRQLQQAKENIGLILNEMDNMTLNFSVNSDTVVKLNYLLGKASFSYDDLNMLQMVKSFLNSSVNSKLFIYSIYIYYENDNKRFITSSDGIQPINGYTDTSWYESYKNRSMKENIWTEVRYVKKYAFENSPRKIISVNKVLSSIRGVIVLNINADYMEKLLESYKIFPDQSIFLLNSDNGILLKNNTNLNLGKAGIGSLMQDSGKIVALDGVDYFCSSMVFQPEKYDWKYLSLVPLDTVYKIPSDLSKLTVLLLVLSLMLGLMIAYFMAKKDHNQILNIISIINKAEKGEPVPDISSKPSGKNEYGYIINNIIKTFIEQSYLKMQLSEKNYKMYALELLALQSQINPHFFHNAVNAIYWEAISFTGKPNRVTDMLEKLSGMLEYSLFDSLKTVTLEEEINNTICFIEMQKICQKDKFQVKWKYDAEIKSHRILKLILQPLVENSLNHGIKLKEEKGGIKIRLARNGEFLKIAVVDNGMGIKKEALHNIKVKLSKEWEYDEHIGLFNTNERLKLFFGEKYGISIRSKYGTGTAIYINLPLN